MNTLTNINSPGYVYIQITNSSGYIARFRISYILRGKVVTELSKSISLGQNDKMFIPEEATSIILDVEQNLIIGWRPFYYEKFTKPINKCYKLSGTAFNPSCNEISCVN